MWLAEGAMLYTGELANQMLKAGNPKLLIFILKDKLLITKVKIRFSNAAGSKLCIVQCVHTHSLASLLGSRAQWAKNGFAPPPGKNSFSVQSGKDNFSSWSLKKCLSLCLWVMYFMGHCSISFCCLYHLFLSSYKSWSMFFFFLSLSSFCSGILIEFFFLFFNFIGIELVYHVVSFRCTSKGFSYTYIRSSHILVS